MSDLGDLLELLHGAGTHWTTARLVVRRWGDSELSGTAMRRQVESSAAGGGSAGVSVEARSSGDGPSTWEMTTRAWIDRPGERLRSETSGLLGETLTVRLGTRWWSYTPHAGSISNEDEPEVGGGDGGDFDWMLEPSLLLPVLDFSVTGVTEVAGRPAVEAVAVPRPVDMRRGFCAHIAHGADEFALAVDRERGVVLRAESQLEGHPFALHEMAEVAFDEVFGGDLFRFVSPDGSPIRSPGPVFARPEPVSVEEAARRASFTVLVPARLPQGWTLDATYTASSDRPAQAESVTVHVRGETHMESRLRIHESTEPIADNLPWEPTERNGIPILVWQSPGPVGTWEAKVEMEGTKVRVSANIEQEALLDMVASLCPSPKHLPPFGDF